jgi:HSP20 family protein
VREATPPRSLPFTWDRGFPKLELLRSATHLLVRVALPGVAEEDLRIRLEESDLVIEGEMRPAGGEVGCHSVISEWSYGPFHRRVQLGVVVDPAAMRSELREGLLRIEIDLSENDEQATPDC